MGQRMFSDVKATFRIETTYFWSIIKQAENPKSCKIKDERWWRMYDEGCRMKYEGWKGVLVGQTDEQTIVIVELVSWLEISQNSHLGLTTECQNNHLNQTVSAR